MVKNVGKVCYEGGGERFGEDVRNGDGKRANESTTSDVKRANKNKGTSDNNPSSVSTHHQSSIHHPHPH